MNEEDDDDDDADARVFDRAQKSSSLRRPIEGTQGQPYGDIYIYIGTGHPGVQESIRVSSVPTSQSVRASVSFRSSLPNSERTKCPDTERSF